ncbi:MAG: glycosyltransferase family 4 protein, partial [Alphaproteobacteria bacterium]|nr:glycosyltransferase family 4 protein [Alphaproteobacteria bacterium]
MKKILLVMSKFYPEYSGPSIRIPKLYDAISEEIGAGEINVLCNSIEFSDDKEYEYNGYKVRRIVSEYIRKKKFPFNLLPAKLYNFVLYNTELIKSYIVLNKHYKDADIVHIIGHSGATAAAIRWSTKNKIPAILEMVNSEALPYQRFLQFIKLKLPEKHSCIINFTNDAKKKCLNEGYADNIWTRPNPIDNNIFNIDFDNKYIYRKNNTPFKDSDILICSIAKILPRKNQIFLVKLLKLLPIEYKLIIAGPLVTGGNLYCRDVDYLNKIKEIIKSSKLEDRVIINTTYVESSVYMKMSDVYAMPAIDEGFGTPMIEAIACGLPVIANSEEAAFREWIKKGINGYNVSLDNLEEWRNCIIKASRITKEQRINQSNIIIDKAGKKNIYNKYIKIINELTQ